MTSDIAPWLVLSFAFVFGALWGSFFNVAIYRWPRGMSVVSPGSQCPACGTAIPPYRNVPVFGYLALRGQAACCGARLSPRYFMVELLGGLLCVALAQRTIVDTLAPTTLLGASLELLVQFAFVGALLIATFVDLEHMEIPDEVSLPGTALGLLTAGMRPFPGAADAALGAGMGFLLVQLVFVWSYERLTGRRGMGEGDAKLLMMIGAFVGWQGVLFSLVAGATQGILVAVPLLISGRGPKTALSAESPRAQAQVSVSRTADTTVADAMPHASPVEDPASEEPLPRDPPPAHFGHIKLPFGPFLSLAALEYLFFGDRLVELYLSWLAG